MNAEPPQEDKDICWCSWRNEIVENEGPGSAKPRLCLYYLGHVDPDRLGDLRPADHALGHTGGAGGAGDQVAAGEEHHPHLAVVMSV